MEMKRARKDSDIPTWAFYTYRLFTVHVGHCYYCNRYMSKEITCAADFLDPDTLLLITVCEKHGLHTKANMMRKHYLIKWGLPKEVAPLIYKLL